LKRKTPFSLFPFNSFYPNITLYASSIEVLHTKKKKKKKHVVINQEDLFVKKNYKREISDLGTKQCGHILGTKMETKHQHHPPTSKSR
jgi:hypothetical protein